jgi:hypothetical protein
MISQTPLASSSLPQRIGFYAALFNTLGGILYFVVIVIAVLTGQFTFPPNEGLQLFGGITTLVFAPAIVVMLACLHALTVGPKRVLSQICLGFALLFALAVSINRFSQLGIVRQASLAGRTAGLSWFLPYGDLSIFLGLEYLGWAWFLGLALLFAAPLFAPRGLQGWIRGLMLLYGLLGLLSSLGFLFGNALSLLGFAAWGFVLYFITGLLAAFFRRLS